MHLARAVAAANTDAGDVRVRFVSPGFGPENAGFASRPWLFGLNGDFSPQDEVIIGRRDACMAPFPPGEPLGREQCFRASAGIRTSPAPSSTRERLLTC
jgi:hypothetical protein